MAKCPYCNIEYNSSVSYNAHVNNCAYKNNPLPKPEQKIDYSKLKKNELENLAKEKGIDTKGFKKEDIINALQRS